MNREEASFILANIDRRVCDDELNEALDMAIKALEQQPCGNAIDRAEAIKVASGYCHPANVAKELANLPPVNPTKTGWIPASERLPEEDGLYLVYTEEQPFVCSFKDGEFFIDEVLAWMPLPTPYEPQERSDKE